MNRKCFWILAIASTLTIVGQIVMAIMVYHHDVLSPIRNIGWVFIWISAIFGWLPMVTFRRHGNVAKGKSYMLTTKLVDKGVYSIVRHPQYLAGLLLAIGLYFITQHWISLLLGILNIVQFYLSAVQEEKNLLEKFGAAYKDYMQHVPRFNFLLGFYRLLFTNRATQ